MQEIRLSFYTKPDKRSPYTQDHYYQFYIPGNRFYFTSKRNLLRWIAEINRNLNQLTSELNFLFADAYTEYRTYYFHLTSMERAEIEQRIRGAERMFGLMIVRSEGVNGCSYTYDWLAKIIKDLIDLVSHLQQHPMNKISTVQRYRLENLRLRLVACDDRLAWFPTNGFEKHVPSPID